MYIYKDMEYKTDPHPKYIQFLTYNGENNICLKCFSGKASFPNVPVN